MSSLLETAATQYSGRCVLARNVSVSFATTAPTAICAPARTFVPMFFVLRAGATALNTTASYAVGVTGALGTYITTTVATSQPTTLGLVTNLFTSGSTTAGATLQAAGTTVYFSMVAIATVATAGAVDLIGYIY